jgi:sulfur carrier protein ThiS
MMLHRCAMDVRFHGREGDHTVSVEQGTTVRQALQQTPWMPSMVIVSFEGTVLPHATPLMAPVELLVTTISSGG